MDEQTRTVVEAAAFRQLVKHLQQRTDVQNIDIMNLAGFCRNCLAKWYSAEAQARGETLDYTQAQTEIYGMSIAAWKTQYQSKASPEQMELFAKTKPLHAKISGHGQ